MNRFKIALGREQDFIDIWKQRESYLDEVPGFILTDFEKGFVGVQTISQNADGKTRKIAF